MLRTKVIGRQPTDHGAYNPSTSYGKKFIVTLFDCGWESKHDNNTSAPATLNAQTGTITENTTDWKKKWGSYKQWLIDNGYQKMDATNVKDGNNNQHQINASFANEIGSDSTPESIKGRITNLEEAVGSGGSVDERIAEEGARHYLKSETYTKEEVNGMITTPNQEYVSAEATEQTTAATDVLPATGATDTIYRVANWDGSQYNTNCYSEYTWNTSTSSYIKLSTKDVGIDDEPTAGSDNLVKSGGVYPTKAAVESITKKNNNLLDINKITIGSFLNPIYHNIVENADYFSTPRIAVEEGQVLYFNSLGKLVVFKSGAYDETLDDNANNVEGPWTVPAGVTEIQMAGFVDILGVDDPYISVGVNVREPYGYQLLTSNGVEENSELPVKSKDVYDFVGDAIEDIESQIESPEVLYAEVDSDGRGLRELTKDAEIHHLPQVFGDKVILTKKAYDSLIESMDSYGIHQISKIELGTTQAVFSSEDPDASPLEDIRSQNQTIIKYNGMYYMWYLACGTNGFQFWDIPNTGQYAKYAWMFAYSTDGVNWHREFPAGVTPPWGSEYPNSIKILKNDGTIDNSAEFGTVFIVKDSEYPFRCMCAAGYLTMKMSRDGFTWDKSVVIDRTQYRDCDCGVVIRNNIMKIYTRGWTGNYPPETIHGYGSRIIVVLYADLDGNLICPAVPFSDLNSNYESGVAVIDDRRELLFTPLYRGESYPVIAVPYIVDGARVKQLKINNAYLLDNDTWKSIWWRNGMFYENGKFYCYYYACDKVHNEMASPTAKTKLFRVEVKLLSNIQLNNENLI